MIGKTLSFLLLVAVVQSAAVIGEERYFHGVDPNTLSCDPEGQVHLLLPHFTECTKFYQCANGREVERSCPSDLYFDFEIQVCNWPKDTKCWLRDAEEDIEGSGQDEGELEWSEHPADEAADVPQVDEVEKADQVDSQFSAILDCSNAVQAARQVPYKGDCQRYWRCVESLPQSVYCSDGLFFNHKSQQCDFEANVACDVTHDDELQGEFMVYE